MVKTVIYADVLVLVNTAVDFLILLFTEKITKIKAKPLRLVLGSFVSGISSLCIFLPKINFMFQILLRLIISALTVITAFGVKKLHTFLRVNVCFFASTLLYAGLMYALYFTLKPNSMQMQNGIAYFNISPLMLITVSTACYIVLCIAEKFSKRRNNNCARCSITFYNKNNTVKVNALIDTGNAVNDILGGEKVAILSKTAFENLFPESDFLYNLNDTQYVSGIRLIPVRTVSGTAILNAKKCDYAYANNKKINKPLLALSKENFDDDYDAVIGTDFLD